MDLYGATDEDFAKVKVKNAKHGLANPKARYRKEVTVEEVLASPMVADPLRLLEICATSDGGAAVVLMSQDEAERRGVADPLTVAAISTVTPTYPNTVLDLPEFATDSAAVSAAPELTYRAAISAAAYEEAGLGPDDIDLAEVYDLSTALELDWVESLGLCKEGEAEQLVRARRHQHRRPHPREHLGRPVQLRRGHPRPGPGPGLRADLAAAGPGRRPPGRGRPGRHHRQPGPVRPRLVRHPDPLDPRLRT